MSTSNLRHVFQCGHLKLPVSELAGHCERVLEGGQGQGGVVLQEVQGTQAGVALVKGGRVLHLP